MNEKETKLHFFYSPEDFRGEQPGIAKPERRKKEKGVPEKIEPPIPPRQPEPRPEEPKKVPEKVPERETVGI